MTVTGPQLLTAKRASQKAASFSDPNALNPQQYQAMVEAEGQAASNARKAIEGIAPETAPLNDILEESARYSGHAKQALKNNPAAILTDSESTGSVPTRAMRQFLDKHGGSDLESMAGSLSAGRALTDPNRSHGFWHENVGRPIGKALMKTSGAPKSTPADYDSLAAILAAIANSKKGEE